VDSQELSPKMFTEPSDTVTLIIYYYLLPNANTYVPTGFHSARLRVVPSKESDKRTLW
jgi:hypothetical protein